MIKKIIPPSATTNAQFVPLSLLGGLKKCFDNDSVGEKKKQA